MNDVLKIEGMHVRPVATEVASRRKLYAGLMLGGALLVGLAIPTMWKPTHEEKFKDSAERSGYMAGRYGIPIFGIGLLAFAGWGQLRRGRRAQQAAERTLSAPNEVWLVSGLEVRPFNVPNANEYAFAITSTQRVELYRKPRVG